MARMEVIKLAKENGEDINAETADLMIDMEIERQRAATNAGAKCPFVSSLRLRPEAFLYSNSELNGASCH